VRINIEELDISYENLSGKLDLNDFTNLEKLDCSNNKLTELNVGKLNNLEEVCCNHNDLSDIYLGKGTKKIKRIECEDNQISSLNFLNSLDNKALECLNLNSNNLKEEDELEFFSKFENLKELHVSNKDKKKIIQSIYNRFSGNLEPLKDLSSLGLLCIENTDISGGIEYLPDNLTDFYCANELRNDAKVKEIFRQLNNYGEEGKYNLQV